MANTALLQRMERLRQEIALMKADLLTDEERGGLDFIRNDEDLEIAIKFQLEVYYEGLSEGVWAAQHPREYERLRRIAGTARR